MDLVRIAKGQCSSTDADAMQRGDNPEEIEQPDSHANDHDNVEDRFDGSLHRDETVHQPKEDADNNKRDDYLKEWH